MFWCFSLPAGDEMLGVAALMAGMHDRQENGMAAAAAAAASGYGGPVADLGQAVVWPQGVRVPGARKVGR